jgi:hypothetical protein
VAAFVASFACVFRYKSKGYYFVDVDVDVDVDGPDICPQIREPLTDSAAVPGCCLGF